MHGEEKRQISHTRFRTFERIRWLLCGATAPVRVACVSNDSMTSGLLVIRTTTQGQEGNTQGGMEHNTTN